MPFLSDVKAKVEVPNTYVAPGLRFSYPESVDPTPLWDALAELGFGIPPAPPIPYRAESWVGDGRHKSSHVFRVENFVLDSPDWGLDEIADRGLTTINTLRRFGVDVRMPISYLDFLRKTQIEQKAGTTVEPEPELPMAPKTADHVPFAANATTAPSRPTQLFVQIPEVVLLSDKAWTVLRCEENLHLYQSVVVPGRTRWTWAESSSKVGELGSALPDDKILFETIELGWQRTVDEVPVLTINPDTQKSLWFLVHNLTEANQVAAFLQEHKEVSARVVPMNPVDRTTAFEDAFLVGAVLPAAHLALLGTGVVSKFPDVIARGRAD